MRTRKRIIGGNINELLVAIEDKNIEKVNEILATEIDINNGEKNPLRKAAEVGFFPVVEALLNYPEIDVNKGNSIGLTPLASAAYYGSLETVDALLARREIQVNAALVNGASPLLLAVEGEHISIAKKLLERPEIDVNASRKDGLSPIVMAISKGSDIVDLLLAHPSIQLNGIGGKTKKNPLYIACNEDKPAMVAKLLAHPGVVVPSEVKRNSRSYSEEINRLLTEYLRRLDPIALLFLPSDNLLNYINTIPKTSKIYTEWLSFPNVDTEFVLDAVPSTGCHENLSASYISEVINNPYNSILVYEKDGVIEGMAVFHTQVSREANLNEFNETTADVSVYMKIDLLCGSPRIKGVGSILLDRITELTKELNIAYIKLEAVAHALPFYLKHDFKYTGTYPLQKKVKGGTRRRCGVRRVRRTRRKLKENKED